MQRVTAGMVLTLAAIATLATAARADALVAAPSGPAKIGAADLIVTGQVLAIEDREVEATTHPSTKVKGKYQIAVVQVTEVVKGDAKVKMVRIGYLMPKAVKPPVGGGKPIINPPISSSGGRFNVKLTPGQNGLFYLTKHHDGDFYTLPMFGTFVSSEQKQNYDNELDQARSTVKVLANPIAALKDADPARRQEAVQVLLNVYRSAPFGLGGIKQEPIDAEQSKLILKALLEADWDKSKYKGATYQHNPAMLFQRLGVQDKDGWQQPKGKGFQTPEYVAAAKAWLGKNWETYRIQKYVATGAAQAGADDPNRDPPVIQPVPVRPPIKIKPIQIKSIQIKPIKIKPGVIKPIQIRPIKVNPAQPGQVVPVPPDQPAPPAQIQPAPAKE